MEVKIVKTKDFYDTMCLWWDGHGFPRVNPSILPENTFVCYNNGKPIYSTCFYNTDSYLCWIGWQIVDPEATKEDKKGGLRSISLAIETYAKSAGYEVVFTTTPHEGIKKTLTSIGYSVKDSGVDHLIKEI